MFKPLLIGSTLIGVLGAPLLQAEQAPATQFQPTAPGQMPPWVQQPMTSAPQLPAWVKERRAQLGITEQTQPPAPPVAEQPPEAAQMGEMATRPEVPSWVTEQHTAPTAPQPPEAPQLGDMPTWPELPAWVKEQYPDMARPAAPTPPEAPQMGDMPARPEQPAWVAEQRSQMTAPAAPVAPTAPQLRDIPVAQAWPNPGPAAQMSQQPAELAPQVPPQGMYPGPVYQPWGGVPYGGWNHGWSPWGNSWGNGWNNGGWPWGSGGGNGWNSGWWPWDSGWGNSGWGNRGWGNSGWGNRGWNDGYGSGWGDGRSNFIGDGSGDAAGDADFSFAMRAWASGDLRGRGDAYGDGYGRGYGYGYQGYAPYPPPVGGVAMAPEPMAPPAPADTDEDGVADTTDLCPDTAAGVSVDTLGCDDAARIVLRGVNFKTDSDELTEESLAILDGVSATLSANPEIKVMVAGHTDADGDDAYNKDLSQRRAQSVVNYLTSQGVSRDNLIAKGYGEEQPIASNDSAEGKAQNRRVELNRL